MTVEPLMQADQIKQREEKNPHDIHEMPVQAEEFNRRVIFGAESPFSCKKHQPDQQSHSNDHVQGVHSCHHEIETEEDLGLLCMRSVVGESHSRNQFADILLMILNRFD